MARQSRSSGQDLWKERREEGRPLEGTVQVKGKKMLSCQATSPRQAWSKSQWTHTLSPWKVSLTPLERDLVP